MRRTALRSGAIYGRRYGDFRRRAAGALTAMRGGGIYGRRYGSFAKTPSVPPEPAPASAPGGAGGYLLHQARPVDRPAEDDEIVLLALALWWR